MAVDPTEMAYARGGQYTARALLQILERARRELLGALQETGPDDRGLTTIHRQAMLHQVETVVAKMQQDMGIILFDRVTAAMGMGNKAAAREIATLAGQPDLTVALSTLNPALVEYHITRSGEFLKAASDDLRSRIRIELATAQAQGLHAREAARRIAGRTDLQANEATFKRPVFTSVRQRAETIARTEFAAAANGAFADTLKQAQAMGLPVGKRWSATLDRRTSRRCKSLHATYNAHPIPLDQPFKAADGWTGQGSPAHPNCRSRIATGWLEEPDG